MPLTIADYSEFQGVVRPDGQQVVIVRAHNGWRPDNDFVANRAAAHAAGCAAVGLYQYLVAGRDAAQQAAELCDLIGTLAPNEWLICDLEEGQGDEQPRWQAWDLVVVARFGRPGWLYSGEAFAAAHDLHPDWDAAYQPGEPPQPHKLWQDTDAYPWPWGRSDASVYDGSLAQFLVDTGITTTPATSAGLNPPEVPEVLLIRDPQSGACYLTNGVAKTYIGDPADLAALTAKMGDPVELTAGFIASLQGAGPV
ncbi:hypothetical protein K6U06_06655 [Acidiferrimicrobium sp. IK]|uniref:hypothetical protein n=1 Tax=Acidiferrimicrobium sp. IK TaxID=2871700 RepID=UPI0021CAFE85|nr:hypothetical protein [Acidiferrimicrobium sp. IK]MCU4184034.1 hypothetical protein [Acidiferrimicrobium sp. IK]